MTKTSGPVSQAPSLLLDTLLELQQSFVAQGHAPAVFGAWLSPLLRLGQSQFCLLAEWVNPESGNGFLRVLAATDLSWDEATHLAWKRHLLGHPLEFHNLDNLLGAVVQDGAMVVSNDPAADPRRGDPVRGHPPLHAFLGLPLIAGGRVIGIMGLANRAGGYDAASCADMQALVPTCSHLLHLYQTNRQLEQAELTVRHGRSRYQAIWESTGEALFVITPEGVIESANPAACLLTDYTVAELTGRPLFELMPPSVWLPLQAMLGERPLQHRQPVSLFDRCGQTLETDLMLTPLQLPQGLHYCCAVRDLRRQRHQEEEVARLSDELDIILSVCPDGVVAFDHHQRVSYCNPAFLGLVGWERHATAGLHIDHFEQAFALLCNGQQPTPGLWGQGESEINVLLERPQERVLRRSIRHTRGSRGTGLVVYFRDVTRETEVDRMKTDFLSTAAHELRTPLASIFGYAELLVERSFDEEIRRDLLQTIYRHSKSLITLINELLDIARIEARAGSIFCIGAHDPVVLIEEVMRQMQAQFVARSLRFEPVAGNVAAVLVDEAKFVQMLQNVVSNALKYSAAPSTVVVRLLRDEIGHAGFLGVQVQDSGIGMSPQEVSRVFERFYRANPYGPVPGNGLGLSLVREIIDILKGNISIQSRPGEGSRVTLWLPIADHSS